MIFNAKDLPLGSTHGTLPNMQNTLTDWFQRMTFTVITKAVINFQDVETEVETTALGVRQPFSARQLMMKPEGQRSWRWETIHADQSLILTVDDVVVFDSIRYRVMQIMQWKEYGYVEYHICQDYTA